jgi:hypothetical protein
MGIVYKNCHQLQTDFRRGEFSRILVFTQAVPKPLTRGQQAISTENAISKWPLAYGMTTIY